MRLGRAFKVADKESKYFWTKTKQTSEKKTFFNPVSEDPIAFWTDYLKFIQNNPKEFQDHIQYSNDGTGKWNSGLTIDSDIYFKATKELLARFVQCGKCIDPLVCDDCRKNKARIEAEYEDAENKEDFIKVFFTEHTFTPDIKWVNKMNAMCEDIIDQVVSFLCVSPQEVEWAKEHTILLRKNITFKPDHLDDEGHPLLRYGFHAYFFNIRLTKDVKVFLAKNIHLHDMQTYTQLWPFTKPQELFDTQPLKGSTSLPLVAPEEKSYPFVLLGQQVKNVWECPDVLESLNPFAGKDFGLKAEYIKAEDSENICEYFQKKGFSSYEHALRGMTTDRELSAVFKDDNDLKRIVWSYTHPPYSMRQKICLCLYKYLCGPILKKLPLKRVQLRVQLLMFVILASQNDIDRAYNKNQILVSKPGWIDDASHNRYPAKILTFTQAQFALFEEASLASLSLEEQCTAYRVLVQQFNAYVKENNRDEAVVDTAGLKSQPLYADFLRYVDDAEYGNYRGNAFYAALLDKVQREYIQNNLLFKYLYSQIEEDIFVMNGDQMFYYEPETPEQDSNKFHAVKENTIEAKLRAKLDLLDDGTQKRKRDLYIQKGSAHVLIDGEDTGKTYIQALYSPGPRQTKFLQDDDYADFKCEHDALNHLLNIFSARSKSLIVKTSIKEFAQRKLEHPIPFTMDEEQNVIGVYNGLLCFDKNKVRFIQDGRQHYISKSTLFKIRPETIRNDELIPPEELPEDLHAIYDDIINIARGIYSDDMYVIEWKMYQVMCRMFAKTYPGDYLFIAFGTGSDGKTTFMQALCNALGLTGFSKQYGDEARRIDTSGYSSVAKSTILQTPSIKSSQHDSGGLIELKGNYLQLCAELQESSPLVASSIKQCLGGTQIVARGAYKSTPEAFINKCFMELQTNFYPTFDKALENGIMRRIIFYKHKVKFIPKEKYDALPEEQKRFHAVADPTVQDRLFNDWRYVDMLGYYVIWNFLRYPHKDIGYVPEELVKQTAVFFSTLCKDMAQCMALIQCTKDMQDFVIYNLLEIKVGHIITNDTQIPATQKLREKQDHMSKIREICKAELRCVNKITHEEEFVAENNFQEKRQSQDFLLIIRGYKFRDQKDIANNAAAWAAQME